MPDMVSNNEWNGLDLPGLFKRYYSHVLRFKSMIISGRIDWEQFDDIDVAGDSHGDEARAISTYLRNKLQEQLDYVSLHARQSERRVYIQAQYLMAALTDEIFLVSLSDWEGQRGWSECLLEKRLFGTSNAGEEVVKRINEILGTEVLTQNEKQLVQVYLLSLRLGFSGLSGVVDRQELLRKVASTEQRKRLFPVSYYGVVRRATAQRMSPLGRWHRVAMWAFVFFLITSSLAWYLVTRPLFKFLGST